MNTNTQSQIVEEKVTSNYYPRIIREFDDDDEPMYWG